MKTLIEILFFQVLDNNVSGSIPTELGTLQKLVGVDFEANQLEGDLFFDELFDLTDMRIFRASKNHLTNFGAILSNICQKLEHMPFLRI